jgi:hypothetical protein
MKSSFKNLLFVVVVLVMAFSSFGFVSPDIKADDSLPVAKIGERINANGVFMTVLNVQTVKQLGEFMSADAGKVFLDVEVYFENESEDKKAPYNPFYFKVKDGDGQEFGAYLLALKPTLTSGDLAKGEFARGHVAFEIMEKSTGFVLNYEPLSLFGGYKEIKVDLSQTAENPIKEPEPKAIPAKFKIGEKAELEGVALTILGMSQQAKLAEIMTPSEGYTFVDLEVLIENIGRDDETPYNPLYFKIKDSKGYEYTSSMMSVDPSLTSGDLSKGEKVRGHVAFEVKADATGVVAIYQPQVILGGYEKIVVNLIQ